MKYMYRIIALFFALILFFGCTALKTKTEVRFENGATKYTGEVLCLGNGIYLSNNTYPPSKKKRIVEVTGSLREEILKYKGRYITVRGIAVTNKKRDGIQMDSSSLFLFENIYYL